MISEETIIPSKTQVLVVGAGPGGSYTAAVLAREGFDVVILEAEKFPRYHIGESMLTSLRHFMRFIDLEEAFEKYGFTRKVGGAFKLNHFKREGYTDFIAQDPHNYSWNVVRAEADDLIFRHAGACGARTFDETRVTDIQFNDMDKEPRPISATWKRKDGQTGQISFEYLVDASGRTGLVSEKILKTRKFNQSLKSVAVWGYWEGTKRYAPGTSRENAPYFEAMNDESGWVWFVPLHNGTTSVGVIMNQEISNRKKEKQKSELSNYSLTAHYLEELNHVPGIKELIGGAKLKIDSSGSGVKAASDYSYSATSYAGNRYRVVGDAGAFIDPFFSSGVHLALTSALSAAATVSASLRGDIDEKQAADWHSAKFGTAYTRFLIVVLAAYRQMNAQAIPVLSDIDEDNFDRAFDFFRPIIQGTSDVGKLTQKELQEIVEFCGRGWQPYEADDRSKVLSQAELDQNRLIKNEAIAKNDAEMQRVVGAINAQRVLKFEDPGNEGFAEFVQIGTNGMRLNLEKGCLGLVKA